MYRKETAQAVFLKAISVNLSAVNKGIKSIEIFLKCNRKTDTADAALESDMPEI